MGKRYQDAAIADPTCAAFVESYAPGRGVGLFIHGPVGTDNYAEKRIMSGNGLPPQVIRSRQPRPLA